MPFKRERVNNPKTSNMVCFFQENKAVKEGEMNIPKKTSK